MSNHPQSHPQNQFIQTTRRKYNKPETKKCLYSMRHLRHINILVLILNTTNSLTLLLEEKHSSPLYPVRCRKLELAKLKHQLQHEVTKLRFILAFFNLSYYHQLVKYFKTKHTHTRLYGVIIILHHSLLYTQTNTTDHDRVLSSWLSSLLRNVEWTPEFVLYMFNNTLIGLCTYS